MFNKYFNVSILAQDESKVEKILDFDIYFRYENRHILVQYSHKSLFNLYCTIIPLWIYFWTSRSIESLSHLEQFVFLYGWNNWDDLSVNLILAPEVIFCVEMPLLTHSCPPFQHLLPERLTSLGIVGEPRVPPLNPSETIVLWEHYRLSER